MYRRTLWRGGILLGMAIVFLSASVCKADEKDDKKKPLANVGEIECAPQWANAFVSVRFADLWKTEYFQQMLRAKQKYGDNSLIKFNNYWKELFGFELDKVERATVFLRLQKDAKMGFLLQVKTTTDIDSKQIVKKIAHDTPATENGRVYYTAGGSCMHVHLHFPDKRTMLVFMAGAEMVLNEKYHIDDKNPLFDSFKWARDNKYPLVAGVNAKDLLNEEGEFPESLEFLKNSRSLTLTMKADKALHFDAIVRGRKDLPKQGKDALQIGLDLLKDEAAKKHAIYKGLRPGAELAFETVAKALKGAKVRHEGLVQHVPLTLKLEPEMLGKAFEELWADRR